MAIKSEPSPDSIQHSHTLRFRRLLGSILGKLIPAASLLLGGVLLIGLLGIAQRAGWIREATQAPVAAETGNGSIFTCPMHPQIRQPSAGRCPICGMELVPAAGATTSDQNAFAVTITPAERRLAHIDTALVERGTLHTTLQAVGVLAIDESRQSTIAAYVDGRLERLFADYTGVVIQQGDHLAVLYSPQLYGAQVEFLEAKRALEAASGLPAVREAQQSLVANTRLRLRELGMTEEQLAELEQAGKPESRLTIYSPQKGTVVEKLAVEGNYVTAGDPIYRIADLSTVWLMLKLFPEDASHIRFGHRVEAIVQSLPGERLIGRVAFIDPTVDPTTRTVGVRVELSNEDGRLKPGDYAEAHIEYPIGPHGQVFDADLAGKWISPMHPQIIRSEPGQCPICGMDLVPTSQFGFTQEAIPQPESLYVPRSAVLLAGDSSVVYVETKPGHFEIRPVTVGPILRDKIVILKGLEEGEAVATSGNFLIDSQMQLAGKPSLIDASRAIARGKEREREGPLTLPNEPLELIGGNAGEKLEQVFAAYFSVQQTLAADQKPPQEAAQSLHESATALLQTPDLPESAHPLVQEINSHSEHLHHMELADARKAFKEISRAVVTLAATLRSEDAQTSFIHFYCPMVKDGGGDWLQSGGELLNPYFGSQMLHCGEKVHDLPPNRNQPDSGSPHETGGETKPTMNRKT